MIKSKLKTLLDIRQKVSALKISGKDAIEFYTKTNATILDTIALTAKMTKSAKFSKQLISYTNFLLSKERAGLERAVLTNVFAKGYFATGDFNKFHKLVIEQDAFLKSFEITALQIDKDFFGKIQNDQSFKEVEEYRQIAFSKAEKTRVITQVSVLMGYNNFIHNFKNYILRGDNKYRGRAIENYKAIIKLFDTYKSLGNTSQIEENRIKTIQLVLEQYKDALKIIQRRYERANNKNRVINIINIDKLVKINDTPAKEAIDEILYNIHGAEAGAWFETITRKINKLKDMEDFLTNNLIKESQEAKDYANGEAMFYISMAIAIIILFLGFTILSIRFLINNTLHKTFNTLRKSTTNIENISENSLQSARQLANNATSQASVVEQLSAMAEETSTNNQSNNEFVEQLKDLASETKNSAEFGYSHIETLNKSMERINESSTNISSILKTIDEIAFQTNLLSLNAAVEAARAGEHGLGFAVVAEEVRALASRSASNAKETSIIIETSSIDVKKGMTIAKDTNESFKDILDNIKKTNELTQKVVISTQEQAISIQEISSAINNIGNSTMDVANNSEQLAQNSNDIDKSLADLNKEITKTIAMLG
jgi:methyl-accepting chemotaxis protein